VAQALELLCRYKTLSPNPSATKRWGVELRDRRGVLFPSLTVVISASPPCTLLCLELTFPGKLGASGTQATAFASSSLRTQGREGEEYS
jgi:hypothetical protein